MAGFEDIVRLVGDYYDGLSSNPSSDPITKAADTSTSDCGVNNSITQIANMNVNRSIGGNVRGYQYVAPLQNPKTTGDSTPSNFDSTSHVPFGGATGGGGFTRGGGAGRYSGSMYSRGRNNVYIPATKTENGFVSGLKKVNGIIGKAIGTVSGYSWAAAAAAGKFAIDMGKSFYKGLTDGATNAWNRVFGNSKTNHPNDYNSIYGQDENGNPTVPTIYEVNDDGTVTMYLPDDVIADIYRSMRDESLISSPGDPIYTYPALTGGNWQQPIKGFTSESYFTTPPSDYWTVKYIITSLNVKAAFSRNGGNSSWIFASETSQNNIPVLETKSIRVNWSSQDTTTNIKRLSLTNAYTYNGKTVYYATFSIHESLGYERPVTAGNSYNGQYNVSPNGVDAWIMIYGNVSQPSSTQGISFNPNATFFDPSVITANDIPTIIQQMNDNYSQQMGSPLIATVMDDSCNEININYHPVSIPITVGVGDVFPITSPQFFFGGGNTNYDPQSNPRIGPGINIDPNISLPDLTDLIPSIELPDIGSLFDTFGSINDLLRLLLDILSELMQGAPGGTGISIDPEINITTNNYYEDHDPSDPDTPLPPINVNPPQIVINLDPSVPITSDPSAPINIVPNPSLPNPTIPVIIPPWPTHSDEPEITDPEGFPTAMWHVYNPSQATVNAFGAWLWNPNFIDVIKRLFESPIDAVFTLHKVFVHPNSSGSSNIVVGSIDSGIPSAVVSSQYTKLDCGSINLDEYFGNVFDYAPYTIIQLYLPFIGIVELDPAYCMRSSISVFYTVDVFTGACVAKVGCKRDGYDICVYEFTGSCSVEYPVSYHSYSSIVSSIISGAISATAGALGTYITTNPMPAIYGASAAAHQAMSGRSEIRHSGSFAGAHGAMGIRKPYLIISRPILEMADDFAYFDGYPANQTVSVGSCAGYIKAKECHLNIPNAYKSELEELDALFKSGVIVS